MAVPDWVVAPLVRAVRANASIAASSATAALRREVFPLRCSVHVGEDFTHLMTGLRRIHGALRAFELSPGDRLGHAVALGVQPRWWCERSPTVLVAREERMFDLLWELLLYRSGAVTARPGRAVVAEHELTLHAQAMFGGDRQFSQIARLASELHDARALACAGFPDGSRRSPGDDGLLRAFLDLPGVFKRGREPVAVDVRAEVETLRDLQQHVRRELSGRDLVVEINPSSNLLIGDLRELERHPLWGLRPPRGVSDVPIAVCVGSDDPLTFDTTLPREYQIIFDALRLAGVSADEGVDWLDHARRVGLDARFSVPRSDRVSPLALQSIAAL